MAIAAAGALALTACTSDSGSDSGSDGADSSGDSGSSSGSAAGPAKVDMGDVTTNDDTIYYSAGEQEWEAYNADTSATNSTYNAVVMDQILENFVYFGTDGSIQQNEDFGSYEVTSEDPFTVEYTIADDAAWSDGTPITSNDFLLQWASSNPEALGIAGDDAIFDPVSDSFGVYVPEGPETEVDSKTFTLSYPTPYPDWEILLTAPHPSHIVESEAGMEAGELAQAILDKDGAALGDAAEFWNDGWIFGDKTLPDPALTPSSGPYTLDGATWNSPESLTLVPNESYYGTAAATGELVFRFVAPEAQVQALQNGDLNVVEPQATVDTVQQIEAMGDQFTLEVGDTLTWEHLDFNFADGTTFAEDEGGLAAREAFAMCVPRQQIIDNLIAPINEEAVVMNARETFPFYDNYEDIVSASYDGRYDEVDIEGAAAKLEESGLSTPVDVRIGYSAPNQRRSDEVAAITSSCNEAGFNILDEGDPDFFSAGGPLETANYDVALFAWAGSGQKASGEPIYSTGGGQNFGNYSNEEVDAAWDTLSASSDEDVALEQVKIIEKLLWDDLYGIPVFAHPGVVAFDSSISNVIFNSTQTGIPWNAEQWVRAE